MAEAVYDPDADPSFPEPPRTKEVRCPQCNTQYRFIPDNQKEWYVEKTEDYIQRFDEEFERTIDDLDDMFPDTPIKEYMEQRAKKLTRALSLLKKRVVEDERLTLEEECELDNIMSNF
jgi:hypothetical protein